MEDADKCRLWYGRPVEPISENWHPLVTQPLPNTGPAIISATQWANIRETSSLTEKVIDDDIYIFVNVLKQLL